MEDFNYSTYDSDELQTDITEASWDIKDCERYIRLIHERLKSRRSYTATQRDIMAFNINWKVSVISTLEEEIEARVAELNRRGYDVEHIC